MIILGIDPGSRYLGFAILEVRQVMPLVRTPIAMGVLKFDQKQTVSNRLLEIGNGVDELIQKYQPDHLSLEKIFLGKNADSAFKLGHARGVVIYQALRHQLEVFEYSTKEVKKGITGQGSAEKEHVRHVLQNAFSIKNILSLDASDALAMAAYHSTQLLKWQTIKKQRSLQMQDKI